LRSIPSQLKDVSFLMVRIALVDCAMAFISVC
jgi:hypothetical protein